MQRYPVTQQLVFKTLDILAATYQRAGLIVNTKKTEVLPQSMNSATHPTFTIHGDPLNAVHQFTYLGSILTSDCDLDNEVQQRIKLASVAFAADYLTVFS